MKRGCTQCGECLRVCPVYAMFKREEYAPKGKRILMEPLDPEYGAGQTVPEELVWERVRKLSRLCAGCGRCARVCARKLSTADLLADARSRNPHWTQVLWQVWIRAMGGLWPMAGRMAMLIPGGLVGKGDIAGLVNMARALVARPAPKPWFTLAPQEKVQGLRAMVFPGCTAKYARPAWTAKAERFLRTWGYDVADCSSFVCCGGTLHHAGAYKAQNEVREHNIKIWKDQGRPYLATFCASCLHSLHEYAAHMDEEDAALWKQRVFSLSHLLASPEVVRTADAPERIGYHEPCHWDGKDEDFPLLRKGLPVEKGAGLCCGMGGILKMSDAGLSAAMGRACLDKMPEGCTEILTGCSGCVMQLSGEAGKEKEVRHWLDVCDTADQVRPQKQ